MAWRTTRRFSTNAPYALIEPLVDRLYVSRKLVNFRTLTWQSSQGESKEDSTGPPTF